MTLNSRPALFLYARTNEIMADNLISPAWKREGEDFSIEVVLKSTNATNVTGKMTVYHQKEPMDLDPYTPGVQATKEVGMPFDVIWAESLVAEYRRVNKAIAQVVSS